ncbi:MAG: pyridoxal phosphate-dependent aminotransferase [Planctomycetota bacterium]
MIDMNRLLADRCKGIDASGIRKVFELAASLKDPCDLSIGQPHFDVPEPIKQIAIKAIEEGRNGYTMTQGIPGLRDAIAKRLTSELGWNFTMKPGPTESMDDLGLAVTSGTSGGLILSFLAFCQPGDEVIIPDPFFVIYPAAAKIAGAEPIFCDTYPDFKMTAERIEPLITERTKFVLINSPSNPCGVVLNDNELKEIVDLCQRKNVLLLTDEIYDEFTYAEGRVGGSPTGQFPTPARYSDQLLLLRGFSKTYSMTGWRLGYVAGPKPIVESIAKMQQYSFVCAPSMVQCAGVEAFNVDMTDHVAAYARKRDRVLEALTPLTEVARPDGAFYVFPKVPEHLGLTGTEFVKRAIERELLIIPGGVFSNRDTHFRISYATTDEKLDRGIEILTELLKQG